MDNGSDAVFRRAGVLRVFSLEELFAAAETLALMLAVGGERLAILTKGGGIGVPATDALIAEGGRLAELISETLAKLNEVLTPTWFHANDSDIIGDATGNRYASALDVLAKDRFQCIANQY